MPSGEILQVGPFTALSVLLCLAAIFWCAILMPRLRSTADRFLVGLIGLVRHPTSWHVVRAVVDVVILAYLMLPNVKRLFATA